MTKIYPDWNTIRKAHQKPTAGELTFLEFLDKNLSDEYEIYFQPYLNGDRPDIVLMRKGGGILIIEVKDYNLSLYNVNENTQWEVRTAKNEWEIIKSPFNQAFTYKKNLFELHSEELILERVWKFDSNLI